MRSSIVLMACTAMVLLGGCQAEPDFDTKFEQQSRDLAAKARSIDADAKKQLDAAREAEQASAELGNSAASPTPAPVTNVK
ncbi:MAG: hypothetical protein KYX66_11765 [Blastomonas fulva]|uniref:hypothetical protein n=1 Tax=Blastomonas fulva TaxID=1550728 RepID=UPI0024E1E3C6|nr:hypothetical protein [Blastomonas fulva]MDK2757406.1 hypothetical protein [Blastomonas fulva]